MYARMTDSCTVFRLRFLGLLRWVVRFVGVSEEQLAEGQYQWCRNFSLSIGQRLVGNEARFATDDGLSAGCRTVGPSTELTLFG